MFTYIAHEVSEKVGYSPTTTYKCKCLKGKSSNMTVYWRSPFKRLKKETSILKLPFKRLKKEIFSWKLSLKGLKKETSSWNIGDSPTITYKYHLRIS